MNALQRIELLTEHANLVQSIPTLTGLSKIDSLERLSEIVVLLGGGVQDGQDEPVQDKPQEIDVSAIDTDLSSYLAKHDNLQSATHEFFKDHLKGKVIKTVIGDVHILGSSWKHKLKQGIHKDELKAKAIPFIPQILSQGKYEQDRDKYKERTDVYVAFHAFFKEVQIDDELVGVRLLVGERENNEYEFVVYNAYPNAQMDALKNPNLSDTGNARAVLGFDNIVLDEADDVNDEYDDVEFDDSTASLFDGLMLDDLGLDGVLFDDISDDTDGWNIQIISITPIQSKEKSLFGKTKPVDRNKLYNAGLRLVYADDYSMWSNGHILVKENVSDELIAQASNAEKMPVSQLERVIPAKNTQFKLADLATTTNGKKTQLAVLQDEQGNELPVNKIYLQFFIKEFGNDLEYWTNGLGTSPIAIYKGGELVGLIMPMQNAQYEKHSEQEPTTKQDKPVISELVNPYDESQVQAKLDKVKQEYENFGEKSLSPYEKMPANGITVELANARQFLLDKVLKGKDKNVIFTFTDENGNMVYKVGADTRANRSKLINAFGEIDSTKLPNEQLYGQVNGGNIASAKILERLGYQINHTEKDTFYPKNTLPVKNQVYQIDLHGNKGVYLFVGIDNKQQLKDEAELRFLDLESDYLMSMGANRYDELMNAGKIVKVDDMATITKLVNHNAKKEHSIYQTRANGTMIKVFAVGNRYRIETYKNKDDRYPNSHTADDKDEATAYLQREKENYPALKFITGVENLLDREIGSTDEAKEPKHSPSNEELSQNEQQNSPFPPILNKAILDLGLSYVPDSYEKDRVWEYVRNDDNLQNQEMQFMVRILNHQGAGKVSFDIPMNDDEKMEYLRENWTRHNADELVSAMYELFDIYKSHTLAERMKAFEPLKQENKMSEQENEAASQYANDNPFKDSDKILADRYEKRAHALTQSLLDDLIAKVENAGYVVNPTVIDSPHMGHFMAGKQIGDRMSYIIGGFKNSSYGSAKRASDDFKVTFLQGEPSKLKHADPDNSHEMPKFTSDINQAIAWGNEWLGYESKQEDTMNEQQNPNYTQSDIDYLQSIINGTLDLETVDMDKMIEIGEKDEHDPMYEQALQVVSDYLDKLTSV